MTSIFSPSRFRFASLDSVDGDQILSPVLRKLQDSGAQWEGQMDFPRIQTTDWFLVSAWGARFLLQGWSVWMKNYLRPQREEKDLLAHFFYSNRSFLFPWEEWERGVEAGLGLWSHWQWDSIVTMCGTCLPFLHWQSLPDSWWALHSDRPWLWLDRDVEEARSGRFPSDCTRSLKDLNLWPVVVRWKF